MKKIFVIIFAVFACCSSPNQSKWTQSTGKVKVLCTTAMIGDLAAQIGGEQVETLVLIQGEIDPHSYELVKGDGEKLQGADLVFYNGLGLEHGASLSTILQKSSHAHNLGEVIPKEMLLHVEGALDPHIWMDVALFSLLIDPITAHLSKVDPEHAEVFSARASETKKRMELLDQKLFSTLQAIPEERRYLVTSHDAFHYFTRRYLATDEERKSASWKARFAAPEGLAPDGQLSSRHIQEIVDHLKEYQVNTLFPESNVSRDSIQKIISVCKSIGHRVEIADEALYGDSMGEGSYQNMMEHNARVITKVSH